jgi:hypothetical protein
MCGMEEEWVVCTHKRRGRARGAAGRWWPPMWRATIASVPAAVPQEQSQVLLHHVLPPPHHPRQLSTKDSCL